MSLKYEMPEPHVHAELIKAWAEGAVIEGASKCKLIWREPNHDTMASIIEGDWDNATGWLFRIHPTCDYALAKIAELGGDDMVEKYLYWLDGGELVSHFCKSTQYTPQPHQDPFKEFMQLLSNYDHFTKKKRMVKEVLWVVTYEHPNIVKDCFFLDEGVEPSSFPTGYTEHKVPSCTREVESCD